MFFLIFLLNFSATDFSATLSLLISPTQVTGSHQLTGRIQSGASSQAKHGGAYFLAVYGSIEDLLAAPGPYENLGPPFLGGSAQPVTFVLPLTHAHTASAPQRALQQDLFWNRSNVFVTKQIHETCFRTNPAGMPMTHQTVFMMCTTFTSA